MVDPDVRAGEGEGSLVRASDAEGSLVRAFQAFGRMLQLLPRTGAAIGALLWAALIWYVSSRPGIAFAPRGPLGGVLSNFAHAPEYGVFALWMALALPRKDGWPVLDERAMRAILLVAALYAGIDEIHQSFTPHRDASALDALTDFVGAAATLACIAVAGGPRASSRRLWIRLVLGFLACVLAASISTFLPPLLSQGSPP